MPDRIETLRDRIRDLQRQMDEEWEARRAALRIHVERGRVRFEDEVRRRHRAARIRWRDFLAQTRPLVVLTAPVIYGLIVPLVLLDIAVNLYQLICFPVYGIPRVPRRDFIAIDRHHLAYLNALQKLNCVYCGYANGLIAYVREVASRTEAYWCPIKHARRLRGTHERYADFMDYGDEDRFVEKWAESRARLRQE
ncbi:hypothetical protein [Jhaorihella thermophila]|uniref:Uncharacterized protein n=1 Tax=Jhaorihella thermophila TaxID=488547 RepID=A0A1H5TUE3_9RHOB|nr:hypothetical protein [Jhaorihella thermophila]SEF66406.1 hypothetical protein SAMN05421751_10330 [Jhaorihella thermophila]